MRKVRLPEGWTDWTRLRETRKSSEKESSQTLSLQSGFLGGTGWKVKLMLPESHDEGWMKARMKTNHQMKTSFIQKFYFDKNMEGENSARRVDKSQEGRMYASVNVVNKSRQK